MRSRNILIVHRWLALGFAPFLLLQALTGSALLFRGELAQFFETDRVSAADNAASVSALFASAQSIRPGTQPSRIFLPVYRDGGAFAHLSGPDGATAYALLDPGTAEPLSDGSIWRYPLEAALQLHYQLNAGNFGLWLVTLYGAALAVIAATGIWHWWPGRTRVLKALTIPRRTPRRLKMRMWHRSTGALAALALVVMSLTGMLTAIPSLFPPAPVASPAPAPVFTERQIDDAVALAQAHFPDGAMRDIRFRPDGTIAVNFRAPRAGPWAVDTAIVNAATVTATPYEANDALWTFTYPVHTGSIIGPPGRWIILALAAGLIFLAVSGPLQWWRGRNNKKLNP